MAKTKRTQDDRWQPVFYETTGGERPAWDFLTAKKTPIDVRIELLTTVRAVLQVGPPRFPTSTQRWRLMHKPASKKESISAASARRATSTPTSSTGCSAW
ncbi:MAG TPA: hypothetical protein VNY27_07680 [Solirubrobacteraceae bacterium]|nr:hypothetical protein [Solirubrobacteraceae bacterium]